MFANAILGLVALGVLLVLVAPGTSTPGTASAPSGSADPVSILLVATVLLTALQFLFVEDRAAHLRERRLDVAIAILAVADLVFSDALVQWLTEVGSVLSAGQLTLIVMFVRQALVLLGLGAHALRLSRRFAEFELAPGWILIGSFFALIGFGTLLLKHPAATHAPIGWLDALFTATSAVTVTGLTVVDTGSTFTGFGQGIVLSLLQVGGLGVMTLTYFVVVIVGGNLTRRDRMMIREILSEGRLAEVGDVLRQVVWMTLVIELVGAIVLLAALDHPGGRSWFAALFHSVSAFCNAGFSTYDAGLQDPAMRDDAFAQLTMMTLIVIGGLGFPVLRELNQWLWAWRGREQGWRKDGLPRLSLHTRIVLITTATLLVGGTAVIYVTEFVFSRGTASVSPLLTAAFDSVTARTAGFSTVDLGVAAPATILVLILLMIIGGSPASTAGGIRTTTFAVASANVWRAMRGQERLAVFGTPVPARSTARAFAVVSAAILWIGLATFLLVVLEPEVPLLDLLFEQVSAFSTVGLSRGATPTLGAGAQWVLVVTMFAGRVGILVFLSTLLPLGRRPPPLDDPDDGGIIV